jgi:plasmid stabilization system protein ParE
LGCEADVALSRFAISEEADRDLDEILNYLDPVPERPALTVLSAIEKALFAIADYPYRGAVQSELTRLMGVEVSQSFGAAVSNLLRRRWSAA